MIDWWWTLGRTGKEMAVDGGVSLRLVWFSLGLNLHGGRFIPV